MGARWTWLDDNRLRQAASEGLSFKDAAARLDKTRNQIAGRAFRLGVVFACDPRELSRRISDGQRRRWTGIGHQERQRITASGVDAMLAALGRKRKPLSDGAPLSRQDDAEQFQRYEPMKSSNLKVVPIKEPSLLSQAREKNWTAK